MNLAVAAIAWPMTPRVSHLVDLRVQNWLHCFFAVHGTCTSAQVSLPPCLLSRMQFLPRPGVLLWVPRAYLQASQASA
jgi:hypothetical protein